MKTYPIIYSKDSLGNIRVWYMEQDGDRYRTIAGMLEGEKVISAFTKAEGKNVGKSNETLGDEQAKSEIESKYKKQLKTGYFKKIEDVDNQGLIEPMLAKKFTDRLDKVKYPVSVDRKYNGMRCIVTKNGMFSRKGEKILSAPHIFNALQPIFKRFPNFVADGELYNHDYRMKLNEIMKLVRKTVNISLNDLVESKLKVEYFCYDGYNFENITKESKFLDRRSGLMDLLVGIEKIVVVEHKMARNEDEVWKIYKEYVDDQYEGAMVRENGPYLHKRSSSLMKVKPENSDDGIILEIFEGNGNWSGSGKTMKIKWKDKIFDATLRGSYEDAVQFLKDKNKWIGRKVEFIYNDLTGLGTPNYARVDYSNCSCEGK